MTALLALIFLTALAVMLGVALALRSWQRGRPGWAAVKGALAVGGGALLIVKLSAALGAFRVQMQALEAYLRAPRPAGLPPAPTWVDALGDSLARVGGWPFEVALGALVLGLVLHAVEVRRDA